MTSQKKSQLQNYLLITLDSGYLWQRKWEGEAYMCFLHTLGCLNYHTGIYNFPNLKEPSTYFVITVMQKLCLHMDN